jgi:hypothetical protein
VEPWLTGGGGGLGPVERGAGRLGGGGRGRSNGSFGPIQGLAALGATLRCFGVRGRLADRSIVRRVIATPLGAASVPESTAKGMSAYVAEPKSAHWPASAHLKSVGVAAAHPQPPPDAQPRAPPMAQHLLLAVLPTAPIDPHLWATPPIA